MHHATVAASLVIDVVGYLTRRGITEAEICAATGLDRAVLAQPNARLDGAVMERLWNAGAHLAGDPDLGLHTAEACNPGALTIAGYVVRSCRTAGEALDRLARYAALLNDGLRLSLTREPDFTTCRCDAAGQVDNYVARAPRQVMEAMAAGIVCTMRRLTATPIMPIEVTFQHATPADLQAHHRLLGPAVRFCAPTTSLVYATAALDRPLLPARPDLLAIFEPQAQRVVAGLDRHGLVSRRVLDLLAGHIRGTVPDVNDVAHALAMSERAMQRHLRDEGTSFRDLVDDLRRELALRHLAVPGTSATDVAFLLGFSEPAAFTRAFLRWTGQSPVLSLVGSTSADAPRPDPPSSARGCR